MHATTTIAAHSSKRSTGLTHRIHRLARPLAVSIAFTAMMLTGVSVQADALVPSASTSDCGGNSGSGWYVIVGEGGKVYSPEAEAANPELAERGMGLASTEKEVASSGLYVIVGEGGRVYSPEAEAAGWPDHDPSSLAEIDGETHIAVDDEPGA